MNRKQQLCAYALMLITSISIVYGLTNTTIVEVPIIQGKKIDYPSKIINDDDSYYGIYFINKTLFGITAHECIFKNCSIDNSVLYHCMLEGSNVTRTFVYASGFEYWYTIRYVDCSNGRASYNTTTWWKEP